MYYSKIFSFSLLLVVIGTGWSILISSSVIDDESTNSQVILTENEILPKNNFRIKPRTFIQPETYKTRMEMSKQDITPPNQQVVQTLGDTRLFWVPDLSTEDPLEFYQINATLKATGEHSMTYSNLSSVSDATLLAMNNKFETIIYPTLKDFFGPPPDIDNNNKTIILVFDILDGLSGGQFVAGFFYSINQYNNSDLSSDQQFSNEEEKVGLFQRFPELMFGAGGLAAATQTIQNDNRRTGQDRRVR